MKPRSRYFSFPELFFGSLLNVVVSIQILTAQQGPQPSSAVVVKAASNQFLWQSGNVTEFIGLPEVKAKTKGSLAISPTEIIFTAPSGQASIDRNRMISASSGDERIETGGKKGKVIRLIANNVAPYGSGGVLGLVTQRQIDLLTIEFRDKHDAYHGTVFVLPKGEADLALKQLAPTTSLLIEEQPRPICSSSTVTPKTIRVAPIGSSELYLPREYRVILYEQLLNRLRQDTGFENAYRDGDLLCPEFNLAVEVKSFRKGNAMLRASAGFVGDVFGATILKLHVTLRDYQGEPLLDHNFRAMALGDSESLDVAAKIARSVDKKLRKRMKKVVSSTTSPS